MQRGKPERRPELMNDEDHAIISRYGAEYRGIVQYYLLAGDVYRLDRLHWVMVTSLLKTLAGKYDSSVSKMARKYGATIETPHGPHKCLQVSVDRGEGRKPLVATFGGIPLRRQKNAVLRDREPVPATSRRKELVHRLLAGRCELCGQRTRCACTKSANSPISTSPDSQTSPNGCRSWRGGDARPSWSAKPATPASTREANRVNHGIVAGEPGDRKWSRRVVCPAHGYVEDALAAGVFPAQRDSGCVRST